MNDGERNFTQAVAEFHRLKELFEAGSLSEAELKTQLQDLMVEDEHGYWWMIGYQTGQWYRHDETAGWVRADPPGLAPQEIPPASISTPSAAVPEAATATEMIASVTEEQTKEKPAHPSVDLPLKPASMVWKRFWHGLGLALGISLLNLLVTYSIDIFGQRGSTGFFFIPFMSLTSILFGPWVGGFASVINSLSTLYFLVGQRTFPVTQVLVTVPFTFLFGMIPALLVKDARKWKAVMAVGFLLGIFNLFSLNVQNPQYFLNVLYLLLGFLLPYLVLLPLLAWLLVKPISRWGWYWRDLHPQVGGINLRSGTPVLLISAGWCLAWGIPGAFVESTYGINPALGIAGLLSGLVCALVLWWKNRAVRWYHILCIVAGWGIGMQVIYGFFDRISWNGPIGPEQWFELAVAGLISGGITALTLRWAKAITHWQHSLVVVIGWIAAMVLGQMLATAFIPWLRTGAEGSFVARYYFTGLLTGAVGAWIMFWVLGRNLSKE